MSSKQVYPVIVLAKMFITPLQGCDVAAVYLEGTGRGPS